MPSEPVSWCVELTLEAATAGRDSDTVSAEAAPTVAELVADALWEAGAVAVEEGPGRLVGGFPDAGAAGRAEARLARSPSLAGWHPRVVAVPDAAWRDAWRGWAGPVRAGRVVIRPPWAAAPEDLGPGDTVVDIDPGRVYGSGGHPSTRLALAAVVAAAGPGRSVLDVGSGSGVLAVAAAALGADRVVAVDTDPEAAAVTAANARRNRVRVLAVAGPVAAVRGRFDLVVVNLGGVAAPAGLAAELAGRLAPGGRLVVSGLLAGQRVAARDRFRALRPDGADRADGWAARYFRLPP